MKKQSISISAIMGSITETYKVSAKTQQVVDDYDNYVAGGFAPYPVSVFFYQ
jgi:ornithine--oxo-acid transaminase